MIRELGKILIGLASRGEGKFDLDGKEIFIFARGNGWEIATRVCDRRDSEIREGGLYRFTSQGSLAVKDYGGDGVYFLYEVPKITWRVLKNYIEEVESWCKILT